MIILTTSRNPAPRVRSFIRDLSHVLKGSRLIARGKMNLPSLEEAASEMKADKLIIASRWHGGPGKLELKSFSEGEMRTVPPLIYLSHVKLRKEYATRGRRTVECVTLEDEENHQLRMIGESLSRFLDLPIAKRERAGTSLHFKRGPDGRVTAAVTDLRSRIEVGPAFTIRHVVWEAER